MPAPVIAAIVTAGATAGATVYSVKKNQQAADTAAKAQADATAAQTAATDKTLAFQQSEADKARQVAEVNRRAGYDQWASDETYNADRFASREGRISDIGQRLGLPARNTPARNIPGYVPLPGSLASINGQGAGAPAAGGVDPKIQGFIANWQQTHPVSEGIGPLADAIAKQFPGVTRHMYGDTASNNELNIGGQKYKVLGGEGTAGAYWYQPGMNDSAGGAMSVAGPAAQPYGSINSIAPLTPAYVAPRVVPGSLRAAAA